MNEIISANDGQYSLSSTSDPKVGEMDQGFAVQLESLDANDEKVVTTVVPYKVDENKNLINSFEYFVQNQFSDLSDYAYGFRGSYNFC